MTKIISLLLSVIAFNIISSQEIITLNHEEIPGVNWENKENSYFSDDWQNPVVTNVSIPTMEVFRPENPNGTAVVVAPGGGLYALSIESEGTQVAEWLAKKGITAFVLKYRLVPTGEDGVKDLAKDGPNVIVKVRQVLPYSIADARTAIQYVRENAEEFSVDSALIGMMGFSAGGAVTMGTAYGYNEKNRPDFLVPVYAWTSVMEVKPAQDDAPPLLAICSTDDPLGLAKGSIEIYNAWHDQGKPVALNMYAKGGHGYGMKEQNLPSDSWIERFHEWLMAQNLVQN